MSFSQCTALPPRTGPVIPFTPLPVACVPPSKYSQLTRPFSTRICLSVFLVLQEATIAVFLVSPWCVFLLSMRPIHRCTHAAHSSSVESCSGFARLSRTSPRPISSRGVLPGPTPRGVWSLGLVSCLSPDATDVRVRSSCELLSPSVLSPTTVSGVQAGAPTAVCADCVLVSAFAACAASIARTPSLSASRSCVTSCAVTTALGVNDGSVVYSPAVTVFRTGPRTAACHWNVAGATRTQLPGSLGAPLSDSTISETIRSRGQRKSYMQFLPFRSASSASVCMKELWPEPNPPLC